MPLAPKATPPATQPAGGALSHPDSILIPDETPPRTVPLAIVGIGASAGGLAALRTFFENVPADSGLAYVVVVHLSPDHESQFSQLLQPHAHISVVQVHEDMPLESNCVYVIPPNANLNSVDTHLRLSNLEKNRSDRAPVDHFFRTLADTHDGESIAVVLTGTGSDGTLGIKRIKEMNGLAVVQDPDEAEYGGMPQSAIATGLVDLVLPLAQIPGKIIEYAHTRPRMAAADDDQQSQVEWDLVQTILRQVRKKTGRDFSGYKLSTVMRRIRRRMQLHHISEFKVYRDCLLSNPEENAALADEFLISVSSFFRDRDVFDYLERTVIPRIFEGKTADDSVRVWSVGCATGEEAYSLAMLLLEAAELRPGGPRVQVFATDLHERAIQAARSGIFAGDIQSEVTPERLERWFVKTPEGYAIGKQVRESVVFAPHNLLSDPPFSRIDLISCRNLFIYLQRAAQQKVMGLFHYAINPEGFLMLGASESTDMGNLFKPHHKKFCIHRKRKGAARESSVALLPAFRVPFNAPAPPRRASEMAVSFSAMHQELVESCSPPSLLIDARDCIVHISEHAGRYLSIAGGEPTTTIYKLVKEELRIALRAAIDEARKEGAAAISQPVPLLLDGALRSVVLGVRPAKNAAHKGYCLVAFDECAPSDADVKTDTPADVAYKELAKELELTRQRLHDSIARHETGQEELKAGNEELQSINEEMSSMMEELETSKEELQSMNEELQTANQQNHLRVEELSQLTADLQSLMAATDIPTIFLDRELRIVRFTPPAQELFNIRKADLARPISDLTHRLNYPALFADAQSVLERLVPIEREVGDDRGRWFLARILPYSSADSRIGGIVLTLVDFTRRKIAEDQLQSEKKLVDFNRLLENRIAERTGELQKQTVRLRWLAAELAATEQRERKRLAAVLHDDLQQILAAANMQIGNARVGLENPGLGVKLEKVSELIVMAIASSRDLTTQLRPPVLYEVGLFAALRWLVDSMRQRHALSVVLDLPGDEIKMDDDLKALLFECARELLFNVVKHSGVKDCALQIFEDENLLTLAVCDSGAGFPEAATRNEGKSFGLFSVRERLAAVGGNFQVFPRPGGGARVVLTVDKNAAFNLRESPPVPAEPPVQSRRPSRRPKPERGGPSAKA